MSGCASVRLASRFRSSARPDGWKIAQNGSKLYAAALTVRVARFHLGLCSLPDQFASCLFLQERIYFRTARRSVRRWVTRTAAGCPASCPPSPGRAPTTAATCTCLAWTPCPTLRYLRVTRSRAISHSPRSVKSRPTHTNTNSTSKPPRQTPESSMRSCLTRARLTKPTICVSIREQAERRAPTRSLCLWLSLSLPLFLSLPLSDLLRAKFSHTELLL